MVSRPDRVRGARGRRRGSATVRTALAARQILNECGLSPMYVMLCNMKFAYTQALALEALNEPKDEAQKIIRRNQIVMYRGIAQESAKDAAPYLYPKLSNITMEDEKPAGSNNINIVFVNRHEVQQDAPITIAPPAEPKKIILKKMNGQHEIRR